MISIDVKGVFIKLLQIPDVPVIGVHAFLNVLLLVLGVLLEAGLDLRSGCWSECRVVSADEIQMPPLQLSLRTQQPSPHSLHGSPTAVPFWSRLETSR